MALDAYRACNIDPSMMHGRLCAGEKGTLVSAFVGIGGLFMLLGVFSFYLSLGFGMELLLLFLKLC